eukprot:COSAG04_NODE_17866_length_457_cov_0.715084_1_plen_47_part_10
MKKQQSDRVKNFAQSMDDEKRKERYGVHDIHDMSYYLHTTFSKIIHI